MDVLTLLWKFFYSVYKYKIMFYPLNILQFCPLYLSKAEQNKKGKKIYEKYPKQNITITVEENVACL